MAPHYAPAPQYAPVAPTRAAEEVGAPTLVREAATEPTATQNRVAENLVRALAAKEENNRGALGDYARRCFAISDHCSKADRDRMQQALNGVVAAAIANGRLASTDWARLAAPWV